MDDRYSKNIQNFLNRGNRHSNYAVPRSQELKLFSDTFGFRKSDGFNARNSGINEIKIATLNKV